MAKAPIRVPDETIKNIDTMMKMLGLKTRTQAFKVNNFMQPQIINEKTIPLPKSKKKLRCIDVRYVFRL